MSGLIPGENIWFDLMGRVDNRLRFEVSAADYTHPTELMSYIDMFIGSDTDHFYTSSRQIGKMTFLIIRAKTSSTAALKLSIAAIRVPSYQLGLHEDLT